MRAFRNCAAYAMVCEQLGENRLVKFGFSTNLNSRIEGIDQSSPLFIERVFFVRVIGRMLAEWIESSVHVTAKDHHFKREWFIFPADTAAESAKRILGECALQIIATAVVEEQKIATDREMHTAEYVRRHESRFRGRFKQIGHQSAGCYLVGNVPDGTAKIVVKKRPKIACQS